MVGAFEAAGMLGQGRAALALVGGVESMSHVQWGRICRIGFVECFRRAARPNVSGCFASYVHPTSDFLCPRLKNRVTGRSMGEHTEDMAKTWNIGRQEQDALALQGHRPLCFREPFSGPACAPPGAPRGLASLDSYF
jgi:acetyl-CoA C-acetyltransferase